MPAEFEKKMHNIKDRIVRFRDQRARLTEADTIYQLILPTLKALGWNLDDHDEFRSEYRHQPSSNPVDCALFLKRSPVLFIEAKAFEISLDDRNALVQTLNYANAAGVDWCALTNGLEWRVYKTHAQVEAEKKEIFSVRLDNQGTDSRSLDALTLLARENMQSRVIDKIWSTLIVDRQVKSAIDKVIENDSFIRLIVRQAVGLNQGKVRDSLRRVSLQISMLSIEEHIAQLVSHPSPPDVPDQNPMRKMRTEEMLERGLLHVGMILTIRGKSGSEAKILDGKHVEFRGERMTFNQWGQTVTGWVSIQIYAWAMLPDGRSLEALRNLNG